MRVCLVTRWRIVWRSGKVTQDCARSGALCTGFRMLRKLLRKCRRRMSCQPLRRLGNEREAVPETDWSLSLSLSRTLFSSALCSVLLDGESGRKSKFYATACYTRVFARLANSKLLECEQERRNRIAFRVRDEGGKSGARYGDMTGGNGVVLMNLDQNHHVRRISNSTTCRRTCSGVHLKSEQCIGCTCWLARWVVNTYFY